MIWVRPMMSVATYIPSVFFFGFFFLSFFFSLALLFASFLYGRLDGWLMGYGIYLREEWHVYDTRTRHDGLLPKVEE